MWKGSLYHYCLSAALNFGNLCLHLRNTHLNHHMLNCAVTAQSLKHCKESCFRFIEIPFPVDRGGSNFGQSEECPFSAIIIGKILLPIYANHDDAQPSCGACHHSMLEVCPACVSALRCISPAAKRPESYV